MKKRSKKGFTLAELLIVIAILAILIAIMLPVFGAQLNKARAAADLANVRAKYSELVADAMLGDESDLTKVPETITIKVADLESACQYSSTVTAADATSGSNGSVTVEYEGYSGSFATDPDVKFTQKTGA